MKHYHYEVQGFDIKAPYVDPNMSPEIKAKEYQMGGVVNIIVTGQHMDEAITKAKKIVSKKYYRLGRAWECPKNCEKTELDKGVIES